MATTPTYSWPLPDDTDLVKDGAEAIRDLGNAIDTTVSSTTGLVHIQTQTLSTVSSVSFNDVFTSAYRNYRINFSGITSSIDAVQFRLRASGTDNTSSNYQYVRLLAGLQTAGAFSTVTNATTTSHNFQSNASDLAGAFIDVFHPAITGKTSIISIGTGLRMEIWTTQLTVTTEYDGFTIFSPSNITGQISVYGYKD